MDWWVYLLGYLAVGAVFAGWSIMVLGDKDGKIAGEWLMLVLLWPILVLMLVGAWLGRNS